MKFSGGVNISSVIVAVYIPRMYDKVKHTFVLVQHRHQIRSYMDFLHPCHAAREDLTRQLSDCIDNEEHIILYSDVY